MNMLSAYRYGYFDIPDDWNPEDFMGKISPINLDDDVLITTIRSPELIAVYDTENLLTSTCAKIQRIIACMKRHLPYKKIYSHPFVNEIINSLDFFKNPFIRKRGLYAIQLIEKTEESSSFLAKKLCLFLTTNDRNTKEKIRDEINQYLEKPKSIKLLKPFQFSIKPHAIHKTTIDHHALIPKTEKQTPSIEYDKFHDAFWHIEKILIGDCPEFVNTYCKNLQEIGDSEGFEVEEVPSGQWIRDPLLILKEKILVPQSVLGSKLCNKVVADEGVFMQTPEIQVFASRHIHGMEESPFYFEGGNLLPCINQEGKQIHLCGASNLLYSLFNAKHFFSTEEKRELILKQVTENENHSSDELLQVQTRLEQAFLLNQFHTNEDKKSIAKITLATIKVIEKRMVETLGTPVCIVGSPFKSQPEFHLDMFLLPAPKGIVFIQDHKLCCQVLNSIAEHYQLSPQEKEKLETYKEIAIEKSKTQAENLKQITEQLRAAVFQVIPVPGTYGDNDTHKINFINAIIGTRNNKTLCITNGASGRLGRYLQDAYAQVLRAYGIDHMYFIGRETESTRWPRRDPRTAFWATQESLENNGGIHCMTQTINGLLKGFSFKEDASFPSLNFPRPAKNIEDSLKEFYSTMLQKIKTPVKRSPCKQEVIGETFHGHISKNIPHRIKHTA